MSAAPRLVVTRPQPQADAWVERLAALGQPALALPLLVIESAPGFAAAVAACWARLEALRLLMFVSPNAVLQFFAARPAGAGWPDGLLAAATGPGTVAALQAAGLAPAQILAPAADAAQFDAETLWREQLAGHDWPGARVAIVRGEVGRDWLAETLRGAGAEVETLAAYRRVAPAWDATARAALQAIAGQPAGHAWLFSSSEAVRHLAALIAAEPGWAALREAPAIATHPRIAETTRAAGWRTVIPSAPEAPRVVASLRAALLA